MGYEGQDFTDIAGGVSPAFIDALYARYKTSPDRKATTAMCGSAASACA